MHPAVGAGKAQEGAAVTSRQQRDIKCKFKPQPSPVSLPLPQALSSRMS